MSKRKKNGLIERMNGLSMTMKLLIPMLTTVGLIGASVLWLFSTFHTIRSAEAGEQRMNQQVEEIKGLVKQQGNDVKIFILEGRRDALVRERVTLEGKKAPTKEEIERIAILKEQILRIDRQLQVLERQQVK